MANKVYDNFFLSNEVEDQFNSHLDLMRFATIDTSLVGTAGMKKIINRYKATAGTQKLKKGEGNTKQIGVSYVPEEYEIQLAQNDFRWNDEDAMRDPMLVPVGMKHAGTDLFNTMNDDIFAEYRKAPLSMEVNTFGFDAFVDGVSALGFEDVENVELFAFVCPLDKGTIRKELKDTLQYVKEYATAGYVGSVGGVNIYTKKDAVPGEVIIGTKDAVTVFIKTGTEIEQDRDKNTRVNDTYSRKYYVTALTDETKLIKLLKGKDATLKTLTVGTLNLNPDFAEGRFSYEATTENAKDVITAVATNSEAIVTIKNGETTVTSGTEATWKAGVNILTIEVVNGTDKLTYKVKVTKE